VQHLFSEGASKSLKVLPSCIFALGITGVEIIPESPAHSISNQGFRSLYVSFLTTEALLAAPVGLTDISVHHRDTSPAAPSSPVGGLGSHALSIACHDAHNFDWSAAASDLDFRTLSSLGSGTSSPAMSVGSGNALAKLGTEAVLAATSAGGTANVDGASGSPSDASMCDSGLWTTASGRQASRDVWSACGRGRPPGFALGCGMEYSFASMSHAFPCTAIVV